MSTLAIPARGSVQSQRRARAARARGAARARARSRAEPLILFALSAAVLLAIGLRTTTQLHLIYPDALTRLAHAYIAWWDRPPRFRAIGFMYPPLQSVALLPLALVRPLATSLVALPLFSALCGGAVVATLDRTLAVLGVARSARVSLLTLFVANPLFLDNGANGTASCLVMALLAAGLHNFCSWYVGGATSVRSLGFCGSWLALAFLARYETALWLVLVMVAVALVRVRRRASLVEVLALEAILAAPLVYIFLIWSGVSTLVGGGGLLSWITRAGAEHVSGLGFGARASFAARADGIVSVLWQTSPLLLILPGLLLGLSALLRRPMLALVAALVLVGAAVSVLRMWLLPNAELLSPAYQMIALVPMLIAAGWLLAMAQGRRRSRRAIRLLLCAGVLAGLAAGLLSADRLLRHDGNPDDRAFSLALASRLTGLGPGPGADAVRAQYADAQAVATFLEAAVYTPHTVLIDDLALPGVILARHSTIPFRTRAENGDRFWRRFLDAPWRRGKLRYLVVANPRVRPSGYPADLIAARYPGAYDGRLAGTRVLYRNRLAAVLELLPRPAPPPTLLAADPVGLYRQLAPLSRRWPLRRRP